MNYSDFKEARCFMIMSGRITSGPNDFSDAPEPRPWMRCQRPTWRCHRQRPDWRRPRRWSRP